MRVSPHTFSVVVKLWFRLEFPDIVGWNSSKCTNQLAFYTRDAEGQEPAACYSLCTSSMCFLERSRQKQSSSVRHP